MAKDKQSKTSETQNNTMTIGGSGTRVGSAPNPSNSDMLIDPPQAQNTPTQVPSRQVQNSPAQVPPLEAETPSSKQVLKRKPTRAPSATWDHFSKVNDRAVCNYCKKDYSCHSVNHGTSNLLKHVKICSKNPNREVNKKQKTIALGKQCEDDPNTTVSMKLVEFNQEKSRLSLAKMLIVDELPFRFVENEGFRDFMAETQPRFKIPSRITIARDCMKLYDVEKQNLKSLLSNNHQMVSLTTDTWTSIQNLNYMCITAHYIDDEWELNKKILSFGLISDHKGETIGNGLEKCLKEWGILRIGCVTVDNASANNLAIPYLARGMSDWNCITLLNGEFLHMRCCAHILNLIVSDGLKEMDVSVSKIRAACKYVKSSPSRLATFKRCAQEANIASKAMLTLVVPTRWNSTYMMLDVAKKFEKAFMRLEYDDPSYMIALDGEGGPPDDED